MGAPVNHSPDKDGNPLCRADRKRSSDMPRLFMLKTEPVTCKACRRKLLITKERANDYQGRMQRADDRIERCTAHVERTKQAMAMAIEMYANASMALALAHDHRERVAEIIRAEAVETGYPSREGGA